MYTVSRMQHMVQIHVTDLLLRNVWKNPFRRWEPPRWGHMFSWMCSYVFKKIPESDPKQYIAALACFAHMSRHPFCIDKYIRISRCDATTAASLRRSGHHWIWTWGEDVHLMSTNRSFGRSQGWWWWLWWWLSCAPGIMIIIIMVHASNYNYTYCRQHFWEL